MARFDLHRRPREPGYLVVLQQEFHDHLPTRIVAPVLPASGPLPPIKGLSPAVEIAGEPHLIFVQYPAAVPRRELGRPIGSLDAHRDDITRALDLLLTGF